MRNVPLNQTRGGHDRKPGFTADRQGVVHKYSYVGMSACLSVILL